MGMRKRLDVSIQMIDSKVYYLESRTCHDYVEKKKKNGNKRILVFVTVLVVR